MSIQSDEKCSSEQPWYSSAVLFEEVFLPMVAFIVGYFLFSFVRRFSVARSARQRVGTRRREPSAPQHRSRVTSSVSSPKQAIPEAANRKMDEQKCNILDSIPEYISEITQWLGLEEIAAISCTSIDSHRNFWQAAEVWQTVVTNRGLCAAALMQESSLDFKQGDVAGESYLFIREAFRRYVFHISSHRLQVLDADVSQAKTRLSHAEVLLEAAHMARGLMPQDGALAVAWLCRIAERALQGHDPTHAGAARAATAFLTAVRVGKGAFDAAQLERLDSAHNSARHLQDLLEATVHEQHLHTELQTFPEPAALEADADTATHAEMLANAVELWDSVDAEIEREHELRRCNDIDAMLAALDLHLTKSTTAEQ